MEAISQKNIEKIKKVAQLKDDSDLIIFEEIETVADSVATLETQVKDRFNVVDETLVTLTEGLKKKLESELVLEIDKEELKGEPGKDYVLTDNDKEEIGKSIVVPIVERVVEKTEIIREIPIVTENVVEVAKYKTPEQTRDDLESLMGDERLGLNAIEGTEELVDQEELKKQIDELEKNFYDLLKKVRGGGVAAVATLPGGSNTQVQFNDSGAFEGDTAFTWNKTTNVLTISGTVLSAILSADAISNSTGLAGDNFTPEVSSYTNLDDAPTPNPGRYIRVGNVVMASGSILVDITSAGAQTTIVMSLPVASTFSNVYELTGHVSSPDPGGGDVGACYADETGTLVTLEWDAGEELGAKTIYYSFMYDVI